VRDEHDRSLERIERALKLLDRRNVEMVRRLVEDQAVHATGSEERDERAGALSR
jgi:hypothetical protein